MLASPIGGLHNPREMRRLRSLFRATERPEPLSNSEVAPPVPPSPVPAPVAVLIFTNSGTRELETEGSVPRTTDLLNRTSDQLQVRESSGSGWESVDIDELLVVVPPEQGSDPKMRLHRPRQQVRVKVGPYVVEGAAHVPAGSQATSFLVPQRRHFAPLTEATIQHDASFGDYRVAVAIVNLRMAESLSKVGPTPADVGGGPDMRSDPPT